MSSRFLSLIIAALILGAGVQATLHSDGSGATETPLCCIDVNATPRSAQPVEVPVSPLRQVAPVTAALTGAPRGSTVIVGDVRSSRLGGAPLAAVTRQGLVSWVDPRFGRYYLALPYPRGTRATICGAGGCVTRTSTDYGPSQRIHPDRIADLSAVDFEYVCAVPRRFGLCNATLTILKRGSGPLPRAIPTAPATNTEEGP